MSTSHAIHFKSAHNMGDLPDNSINLVVTSPPYPMMEMWDESFAAQNPEIGDALQNLDGNLAFRLMHKELEKVWKECHRVMSPGGILCINIGDATRSVGKVFHLFPSHAIIIQQCRDIGFQSLPEIIWRKQTNAPNKFMGSGMLPPGAYVTLEHEYILIFRKGDKRAFKTPQEKLRRNESAYFWEERNLWFSDLWDFKGTSQKVESKDTRKRSAAYPFELAYRLINMFSVRGDTVLDPFLGTGTTMFASMVAQRNSAGYEIDIKLKPTIHQNFQGLVSFSTQYLHGRWKKHLKFVKTRIQSQKPLKYMNETLGTAVITNQERKLKLFLPSSINQLQSGVFQVRYHEFRPAKKE